MKNIYNEDFAFYPTPENLIDKMAKYIDLKKVKTILEPSAGKGNLVDFLNKKAKSQYSHNTVDIDTIEVDKNLKLILKGKGYKVVHDDFLTFNTFKEYDLIFMNPPFFEGDKHLLRALELQQDGGQIVCLLNAETIKNAFSNSRKDLIRKLDECNADVEYFDSEFIDAERKTDVEIALINVKIPRKTRISEFYKDLKKDQTNYEEIDKDDSYSIIGNNFIKEIINQYNLEISLGIKLINEYNAMKLYILHDFKKEGYQNNPILKLGFQNEHEQLSVNGFIEKVRYKYWRALFVNPKFTSNLTTNLLNEYRSKIEELVGYDFSEHNIMNIRIDMSKNIVNGIEETILKLFNDFSDKYHYYDTQSKNIYLYNGWKTNKSWKINSKIIIPINAYDRWNNDYNCASYATIRKIEDIERVFDYLAGDLNTELSVDKVLEKAQKNNQTKKIELKYFKITFYKKGTAHIEFTDLELLKKFNIFGSMKKNWLPPTYGKNRYDEMPREEQLIIDEFEGKESYNKILNNADYYIVKSNDLLMISGSNMEDINNLAS